MVESYLGAWPLFADDGGGPLNNEALNFANTLAGAVAAVALCGAMAGARP
jgi:hypothetical protein